MSAFGWTVVGVTSLTLGAVTAGVVLLFHLWGEHDRDIKALRRELLDLRAARREMVG